MSDRRRTYEPSSFGFATAGRIVFGPGCSAELPDLVSGWGSRALVCTGSRPERHRNLIEALAAEVVLFPVAGEPTVDTARAATRLGREHEADMVIAIGGGSVLDLGKAVAMLLTNGGDPLDYLEVIGAGRPITSPSVAFAAIPTTAGTGAEVTANAVLASPEHGRKVSLRAPTMLPALALVDPLLTLGCPPPITAASGLDALTQCLEPLVSAAATPITDALAGEGLRRAARGLRPAYADGSDERARADMSLCSLLGGMALANAKLGVVHGFAGVIGGLVNVPHGAVCAALLAPATEATVAALQHRDPAHPALQRYREVAAALTGRTAAAIRDGIDWIIETVALLGIRPLGEMGVTASMAGDIVAKTLTASSTRGNPIELTADELHGVLAAATD